MKHEVSRQATAAALLLIVPLMGGCKARSNEGPGTQTGMQIQPLPPDPTASPGGVPADTANGGGTAGAALTDANIMALLDEANKADSSAGAVAAKKATSADVKTFAREMMKDHHRLRASGEKLAKQLKITPAPPANDPLAAAAQDETSALESAPKGAEFDRTYIEKEVSAHQAVKDLLDQAHRSTQNDQIRKLIEDATLRTPRWQELDRRPAPAAPPEPALRA
jgi:putative membrane protein